MKSTQVPKDQSTWFPYAQKQNDKIALMADRSELLLQFVSSLLKLLYNLQKNESKSASLYTGYKNTMKKYLKSTDDLDSFQYQIMSVSQACVDKFTKSSKDLDATIKKLKEKKIQIATALKSFVKEFRQGYSQIQASRKKMTRLLAERLAASVEKSSKKSVRDPWLLQRMIEADLAAVTTQENAYQERMLQNMEKMVNFDQKFVAEFHSIFDQFVMKMQVAPSSSSASATKKKVTASFAETNQLLDAKLWKVDRVKNLPFDMPTLDNVGVKKQGILDRTTVLKTFKPGMFVVTDSGYLHCFKIKSFKNDKQKAKMVKDARLLNEPVKSSDSVNGFQRIQPIYSLRLSAMATKQVSDERLELVSTESKKIVAVGFKNKEQMIEWMPFFNMSAASASISSIPPPTPKQVEPEERITASKDEAKEQSKEQESKKETNVKDSQETLADTKSPKVDSKQDTLVDVSPVTEVMQS